MSILSFQDPARRRATYCEVVSCDQEASLRYPTPRRMCLRHLRVWLSPGFHGCGCGPTPCLFCAQHLRSGKRVLLVGERENRPGCEADDAGHLRGLSAKHGEGGESAVLDLLERAGALRWGTSRKRLIDLGLRWDNAVNVLGPASRPGLWHQVFAKSVVRWLKPAALSAYDVVVLLGSRVAKTWGESPGEVRARVVSLPHPSGRNRLWNDPACARDCQYLVGDLYADSSGGAEPADNRGMTGYFSIANKQGSWVGRYASRQEALDNAGTELQDDGSDADWYVRHPDGRVEQVSYFGDHRRWCS